MKIFLKLLLLGIISAAAGVAAADRITFYTDDNFTGRQFSADQPVSNFAGTGFNDRVSSAVVHEAADALRPGQLDVLGDEEPLPGVVGVEDLLLVLAHVRSRQVDGAEAGRLADQPQDVADHLGKRSLLIEGRVQAGLQVANRHRASFANPPPAGAGMSSQSHVVGPLP